MGAIERLQTTYVLKGQYFGKVWGRCRHITIAEARKLTGTTEGLGDDKGTTFTKYHTLLRLPSSIVPYVYISLGRGSSRVAFCAPAMSMWKRRESDPSSSSRECRQVSESSGDDGA
jgi:hypothetical protein